MATAECIGKIIIIVSSMLQITCNHSFMCCCAICFEHVSVDCGWIESAADCAAVARLELNSIFLCSFLLLHCACHAFCLWRDHLLLVAMTAEAAAVAATNKECVMYVARMAFNIIN